MSNLMECSHQWATRPMDQRFLSLEELRDHVATRKQNSWTSAKYGRQIQVIPYAGDLRIQMSTQHGEKVCTPTNWGFTQLTSYAGTPAAYLRKLATQPDGPELAAINLQFGLDKMAIRDEALVLGHGNGNSDLRAVTSTSYGRIWDLQVVDAVNKVNSDGQWKIPAATYAATNPKRATTLYASDRDVFIFLVNESKRIKFKDRELYRGFYVWNSETGSQTFGLCTFLYDFVCDNRTIWGAANVQELKIRHTGGAPERFAWEGRRQLQNYANLDDSATVLTLEKAYDYRVAEDDKGIESWLSKRGFTSAQASSIVQTAKAEEGEARSLWQIVNGVTAYARSIDHTDVRIDLEKKAGNLLNVVK